MQEKANTAAGPESRVIHWNEMPTRTNPNGSVSRKIVSGRTGTGDAITVHATTQQAGTKPNPAHAINHTEFLCVTEGVLEITHDGRVDRVEPGDVMLIANGTMHQARNAGDGPVTYFVVSIGGDVLAQVATQDPWQQTGSNG